jgi:streptomycin 6-kinase
MFGARDRLALTYAERRIDAHRDERAVLVHGDVPHERARWLAARSGLDVTSIWDWGVVERVSTGLLGTKVGLQPVARQMLAAADIVCRRVDTAPT